MSDERTIKLNGTANFTPKLNNYKTLEPFRYWCQKVLPLVYDDSLSYYELLCKIIDYLNKTMEDVDTLHEDVTNLHSAYVQLQNYVNEYFSNLDLQEEVNNKLDEMIKNGELNISPYRYNIILENGNTLVEKIESAISKGYHYLYVPNGVYELANSTLNLNGLLDCKFDVNAIVIPYQENGNINTFISCNTNSKLKLYNLHLKGTEHESSYGTEKINGIFVGNNSDMFFMDCIFDTLQPYNFTAAEKNINERSGTLLTANNSNLTFINCSFLNIKNYEIIHLHRKNVDINSYGCKFKGCYFNNFTHSINLKCGYCYIEDCVSIGNYEGSLFNAFAENLFAYNCESYDNNVNSFIDNTEGGLYNSKYAELKNINAPAIIFTELGEIDNVSNIAVEYTIKQNPTLDPDTFRNQPLNIKMCFSNCNNISFPQTNVSDVTREFIFNTCVLKKAPSSVSKGRDTFYNCKIQFNNSNTGNKLNVFIGCVFELNGTNVIGVIKPIIVVGCYSENPLTLYKISDTNDEYILSGNYNINIPE